MLAMLLDRFGFGRKTDYGAAVSDYMKACSLTAVEAMEKLALKKGSMPHFWKTISAFRTCMWMYLRKGWLKS
jgi:hypothetical protein